MCLCVCICCIYTYIYTYIHTKHKLACCNVQCCKKNLQKQHYFQLYVQI